MSDNGLENRIDELNNAHFIAVPVGLTPSQEISYREVQAFQELRRVESLLNAGGWDGYERSARIVGQSPRDAHLQDMQDARDYTAELQRRKHILKSVLYRK